MNGPDSEPTRPGRSPASTTSLRKKLAASRLGGKTNRPSSLDGTSIDRNGKAGWGSMTDINLLLSKDAKSTRGYTYRVRDFSSPRTCDSRIAIAWRRGSIFITGPRFD